VKRFWKQAHPVERDGGWDVELDGKPLRTPARDPLTVPTKALAEAIAAEWNGVEDKIDPGTMPLTGLANATLDRVAPDKEAFAEGIARYAEADLACYRAEGPSALVERQAELWDPLLEWGRRRFDVDFCTTSAIVHVDQPAATIDRLSHAVAALDPFRLAVIPALERHDAWGIRLIPTTQRLEQIWLPAPTPMPDGVPDLDDALVRQVFVTADLRPVRLLGLSTPRDVDVERVTVAAARQHEPGGPVILDDIPFHRWDPRSLLLAPADRQDWSPGIYQIRIDLGESETAITVAIIAATRGVVGDTPR